MVGRGVAIFNTACFSYKILPLLYKKQNERLRLIYSCNKLTAPF